jgi:hypothetical protein
VLGSSRKTILFSRFGTRLRSSCCMSYYRMLWPIGNLPRDYQSLHTQRKACASSLHYIVSLDDCYRIRRDLLQPVCFEQPQRWILLEFLWWLHRASRAQAQSNSWSGHRIEAV